jgi:hypothetical protein
MNLDSSTCMYMIKLAIFKGHLQKRTAIQQFLYAGSDKMTVSFRMYPIMIPVL